MNNILLFLTGLLVFILPIPHTISIRNISLGLLLLLLIYLFQRNKIYKNYIIDISLKKIIFILLVLTFWMYFVACFLSSETAWSLHELRGQWITPLIYLFTFMMLAMYSLNQKDSFRKHIYTVIFLMFCVHIIYIDLYALKYYVDHKILISRFAGLTSGPDKANYLTNIILAYLVSEFIYRIKTSKKMLNINNYLLVFIFILTLLSSLIEGMRNGVVAILFLITATLFFSLKGSYHITKKMKFFITFASFLILSLPVFYNITHDTRWNSLIETIPIALDTKNNKAWIDRNIYSYPKLQNGQPVSGSNYDRFAWGYEGIKLIIKNPLGTGYGRNAFGHNIEAKYNLKHTNLGHSHSGIIDLGIGIGIPGIILWLSFGLFLIYISYNYFIKYTSFYALVLFFNTTGFYSRFLVDSNMRDHMFETFMIIVGVTFILMLKDKHTQEYKIP